MTGRAVSRILIELGLSPIILIDDARRKEYFSDLPNVEFRVFSWYTPSSILEALAGGEVLYYNIEIGLSQKEQADLLNDALDHCHYKYVVLSVPPLSSPELLLRA